jgi:predicted nucleic acid-binding protein
MEAEAVKAILLKIGRGEWKGVKSAVVDFELGQMPDPDRLIEVGLMVMEMKENIVPTVSERERASLLEGLGFKSIDAVHLACAEKAEVDVFLTTDDQLLKRAKRCQNRLGVKVANPLHWFEEMVR